MWCLLTASLVPQCSFLGLELISLANAQAGHGQAIENAIANKYGFNVPKNSQPPVSAKIAFITAVYGAPHNNTRLKAIKNQTIPVDWICFTDQQSLKQNSQPGWIYDYVPYHVVYPNPVDDGKGVNSILRNKHPFSVYKYYKVSFQQIPRLKHYEVVVWMDSNLQITNTQTATYLYDKIVHGHSDIVAFSDDRYNGSLAKLVLHAIREDKYNSTMWLGVRQPQQEILKIYRAYLAFGYNESHWRDMSVKSSVHAENNNNFGVWHTTFFAVNNKDLKMTIFLRYWYKQIMQVTLDELSFPMSAQMFNIVPYTLPDEDVWVKVSGVKTMFYTKRNHSV